jgi:2-polyprenyl-3-methyl-5-hydroxy-6-metoxy-1,4-benzoquinol methylase
MNCRHCGSSLEHTFLDLGFAPPSNAYLNASDLKRPELYFPLKIKVCHHCWLVQTEDYASADSLFTAEYAYFSATSRSWLEHAERYTKRMISELNLTNESFVMEIASNDGYLLKNFVEKDIPCLGIEPTDSTADEAEKIGVPVLREFFGEALGQELAQEGKQADLIVGNNVYAHVPDINDFTKGLKAVLKPNGTITMEFPHLMRLIEQTQFDTVYHEHFSYLSLAVVKSIFDSAGLRIWHVEELSTHGGSLRVYGCHQSDSRSTGPSVDNLIHREMEFGLCDLETYVEFRRSRHAN